MWQRKSESEIKILKQRRSIWESRYNPFWPLFSGLALGTFEVIHKVTGAPNAFSGLTTPLPFADAIWSGVPAFLFGFVFAYFLLLRFPWAFRPTSAARRFFCPRCRQPMSPHTWTETRCSCGTPLEPLDWWQWHDDIPVQKA
jgi:hypothetical protein